MGNVVNLARERRKRQGLLPELELIGAPASADELLRAVLESVEPEERAELLLAICTGSYSEMIGHLLMRFEITDVSSRALG